MVCVHQEPFELTIEFDIDAPNVFEQMCRNVFRELERHGISLLGLVD
jgi:hypothetical protein